MIQSNIKSPKPALIFWALILGYLWEGVEVVTTLLVVCHPDGWLPAISGLPLLSKSTGVNSFTWTIYVFDEFLNVLFWSIIAYAILWAIARRLEVYTPIKRFVQVILLVLFSLSVGIDWSLWKDYSYSFEWKFKRDYSTEGCPKTLLFIGESSWQVLERELSKWEQEQAPKAQ